MMLPPRGSLAEVWPDRFEDLVTAKAPPVANPTPSDRARGLLAQAVGATAQEWSSSSIA